MRKDGHHLGSDRHKRDCHRERPCFEHCAKFLDRREQASVNPADVTLPPGFFAPMLPKVFTRKAHDAGGIGAGNRVALVDAQVAASRAG